MNIVPLGETPRPFRLRLPRRMTGLAVHVGVRPEHLMVATPGRTADGVVRMLEPLGAETLVHLEAGGQPLVARVPGIATFAVDARVALRVDPGQLHYFGADGARLA
jgi:ABC-type sugar transport system ATPase subunit